jgi:hypothetical protein|nr:MAG TPA: hypothetical protein [Caudoviricetes sp.]
MKIKKYGNIYGEYTGIQLNFWEWLKRKIKRSFKNENNKV